MKNPTTYLANFFAKHSVDRWNRFRPLRVLCRAAYQTMSEVHVSRIYDSYYRLGGNNSIFKPGPDAFMRSDTYPWPYCDPDFANWEENDTTGSYTLVSDPAGFVIKRSTSYCAWKIRELTGRWPKNRQPGVTYHARNWQAFLAENGYTTIIDSPADDLYQNCIGIDPNCGEFGQLYWYEGPAFDETDTSPMCCTGFSCSTYVADASQRFYQNVTLDPETAKKLTWVIIR